MANSDGAVSLSDRDLKLIRVIVVGLASAAERTTHIAAGQVPRHGSRSARFLDDAINLPTSTGGSHIHSAHINIAFYNLAAMDHMRSFVTVVSRQRQSVSLATLTRGAIEAFGKSNHLLSARSAAELLRRHVGLALYEMGASAKHSEFKLQTGERIDGWAYLKSLREMLSNLGIDKPETVGVTELATEVLNVSSPGANGRSFYSQLSGVAHGESAAVLMFLHPDVENGVRFTIPRELILEYTAMLFGACRTVVNEMIDHFQIESEHQDRWKGAVERAEYGIEELRTSST